MELLTLMMENLGYHTGIHEISVFHQCFQFSRLFISQDIAYWDAWSIPASLSNPAWRPRESLRGSGTRTPGVLSICSVSIHDVMAGAVKQRHSERGAAWPAAWPLLEPLLGRTVRVIGPANLCNHSPGLYLTLAQC